MIKILTIIGARPQFVKAAMISRELKKFDNVEEVILHTGQHYDENMSKIFFEELSIDRPQYNLGVGSGTHGFQTGNMLIQIEDVLFKEKPDIVLVYGDTNSTLAGALAASKLNILLAHVEAGLRSFNRKMPEEKNRILTDHLSDFLFAPTETACQHLKYEGIKDGVFNSGDVMFDSVLFYSKVADVKYKNGLIINDFNTKNKYYLATVHRAENTEDHEKLGIILKAFSKLEYPVLFPVHPRIKFVRNMKCDNVVFCEPVGYLEMLYLIKNCEKVLTDSGGLQKEAYFLEKPCVTLRNETEWIETLEDNRNILTKIEVEDILKNINFKTKFNLSKNSKFGDGTASNKIVQALLDARG